jgi:hypothetical protein
MFSMIEQGLTLKAGVAAIAIVVQAIEAGVVGGGRAAGGAI